MILSHAGTITDNRLNGSLYVFPRVLQNKTINKQCRSGLSPSERTNSDDSVTGEVVEPGVPRGMRKIGQPPGQRLLALYTYVFTVVDRIWVSRIFSDVTYYHCYVTMLLRGYRNYGTLQVNDRLELMSWRFLELETARRQLNSLCKWLFFVCRNCW